MTFTFTTGMHAALGGCFGTEQLILVRGWRGSMTPYAHAPFVGLRFARRPG